MSDLRELITRWRAAHPDRGFKARVGTDETSPVLARLLAKKSGAPAPVAEILIYDAIGRGFFDDGVTAEQVDKAVKQASAAGATSLVIRVNSPGGDVHEGMAIYNSLKRFAGEKLVYVDGLAASAASFVAMVGDKITSAKNSTWMVHNPWTMTVGSAADLRKTAEALDKVGGQLAETYAARTRLSLDDVKAVMDAETWMNATEAQKVGFADAVLDPDEVQSKDPEGIDKLTEKNDGPAAAALLARRNAARARVVAMSERAKKTSLSGQPGNHP